MIGGCEERERMMVVVESVVCPKPRRLGLLNPPLNEQIRPLRFPVKYVFPLRSHKFDPFRRNFYFFYFYFE